MKGVLLDQGLAPNAAVLLRASGWDAVHVAGLDHAEDREIVDYARQSGRICVTFDHDFHSHLALTRADGPSIILIRAEGIESTGQSELIKRVLSAAMRSTLALPFQ